MSLERYLDSDFGSVESGLALGTLPNEGHVEWWRRRASGDGAPVEDLVRALPQFRVPVVRDASSTEIYRRLVLAGESDDPDAEPIERIFRQPEGVQVSIQEHPAGDLPVLEFADRSDFERGVRALGSRCEPVAISPSVHALYVSGLPNSVRASELRNSWFEQGGDPAAWSEETKRLRAADPTVFHDRMILLHSAPYAGIPAMRVEPSLDEVGWTEKSRVLRLEHEFTHHATHRILGSYRLHVHDEFLADLMGFTKSIGRWDADLFLLGLGIEGGRIRPDARLQAYIAKLDPNDLADLIPIIERIARNLESIAELYLVDDPPVRLRRLVRLAGEDLRTMMNPEWPEAFLTRDPA